MDPVAAVVVVAEHVGEGVVDHIEEQVVEGIGTWCRAPKKVGLSGDEIEPVAVDLGASDRAVDEERGRNAEVRRSGQRKSLSLRVDGSNPIQRASAVNSFWGARHTFTEVDLDQALFICVVVLRGLYGSDLQVA